MDIGSGISRLIKIRELNEKSCSDFKKDNLKINLNNYKSSSYNKDYVESNSIQIKKSIYSECPDIPSFPGGNTPPDNNNLKLIYLNLVASRSRDSDLDKM